MKKTILLFLLFPAIAHAVTSWWLTVEFAATETHIEGIPVTKLDPSWVSASALTREKIPKEALASDEMDPMKEFNYRFDIEKDINGDGKNEKILTGVYKDKNKKSGRFVLVLEKDKSKWKKSFVFSFEEKSGFSILNETSEGVIFWTFCMECGMASYIKWDGKKFYIEW
ncbi:MAG: hypothetical protein OEY19_13435 [Gammaproteobacteria bacterium]|nr:hypothetical protein [Gammaproteobacteria bacterium]